MATKRRLILIISILIVINTFVIILSKCTTEVVTDENITKQINNNVTVSKIIYSKKFNKNKSILQLRDNIDLLASINESTENKVDKILNSKIFKETFNKIALNYIHSIRDNKYYKIFDIDDYEKIVDDNIDELLNNIDIDLLKVFKKPITNIIKKMGTDITDEISTTEKAIKKVPHYKRSIIQILMNKTLTNVLLIIDISLLILLVVLRLNFSVISNIILINISLIVLLVGATIILNMIASKYNNEWMFIKNIFDLINDKILLYQALLAVLTAVMVFSYKIKKSIAK